MADERIRIPVKVSLKVEKYHNERTPADGEPDEILVIDDVWLDVDNTIITDVNRIIELENTEHKE